MHIHKRMIHTSQSRLQESQPRYTQTRRELLLFHIVTHIHDTLVKILYSPVHHFLPRDATNMTIYIIMMWISKLFSQVSTINGQSVKKLRAKLATKLRQDMLPLVKSMQKPHPKARLLVLRDFWERKKNKQKSKSSKISSFTTETWKTG